MSDLSEELKINYLELKQFREDTDKKVSELEKKINENIKKNIIPYLTECLPRGVIIDYFSYYEEGKLQICCKASGEIWRELGAEEGNIRYNDIFYKKIQDYPKMKDIVKKFRTEGIEINFFEFLEV